MNDAKPTTVLYPSLAQSVPEAERKSMIAGRLLGAERFLEREGIRPGVDLAELDNLVDRKYYPSAVKMYARFGELPVSVYERLCQRSFRQALSELPDKWFAMFFHDADTSEDRDSDMSITSEEEGEIARLRSALHRLDPVEWEPIFLKQFLGKTWDEVAEILGVSRATAIRHYNDALNRVRTIMIAKA